MQEEIEEISLSFIAEYAPNCYSAMVTGSASVENMTLNSDIDILIIDSVISRDYFESFFHRGRKIDCIVMPLIAIKDILKEESEKNSITYIDMLYKGTVIKDTNQYLQELKKYAIELRKKGPKPVSLFHQKMMLFYAYNLYEDLIDERDWGELLFIAVDLFNQLIILNNVRHNYWTTHGKWKYRYLVNYDKKYAEELVKSFNSFVAERNKTDFLLLAKENLTALGPKPRHISSRLNSLTVGNDFLTVSIKTTLINKDVYEVFLKEIKKELALYDCSLAMFYMRNDGDIRDESSYLIFIHGDEEILNFVVRPLIVSYIKGRGEHLAKNDMVLSLPYYLEPHSLFTNQGTYELTKSLLMHFNSIYEYVGEYDENLLLTYLMKFHFHVGMKLGFSIENYIQFNEYLTQLWLPFMLDKEYRKSFRELEEDKAVKIGEYKQLYGQQKEAFVENYSGILKNWKEDQENDRLIDDYTAKALSLMRDIFDTLNDDFFRRNQIPQFKLNQITADISDLEKTRWLSLSEILNRLYGSVLLSSNQKTYLAFACSSMLGGVMELNIIVENEN
ncbi:nucleotidyltransferase domain-containing protein [Prolixibacter sp. SD074]|uniref:nucleotidyltransferase domain-containing protein n=1 Tax=Prolixibacter sp. SD074 TaxID=2652391 RepID=UPI00127B7B3A|nr:nucleotidyltransferase domain-containing protein [Prolixibacter sp. SD074]GET29935.1 hypothetical protein SD074_21370 [Prolixibacter sp. SD074]